MSIRRRTGSLLRDTTPNHQNQYQDGREPNGAEEELGCIRSSNANTSRALLRLTTSILCLISIGCIAWAVKNGLHKADHHVWDWQDVPWLLIPASLSVLYTLVTLLSSALGHHLHPIIVLSLDISLWIALATANFFSTVGAIYTLQWEAAQYYHDENSGHDGYYVFNPQRGEPGQPRFLKVPPQNATVCSGFDGDCAAQEAFTQRTHQRAKVELVGVCMIWGAALLYVILVALAGVTVHKWRTAKKRLRGTRVPMQQSQPMRQNQSVSWSQPAFQGQPVYFSPTTIPPQNQPMSEKQHPAIRYS